MIYDCKIMVIEAIRFVLHTVFAVMIVATKWLYGETWLSAAIIACTPDVKPCNKINVSTPPPNHKKIIFAPCVNCVNKRRVSEIDLSQPRHETAFWWRHNGPVKSQLTDRIKWPNYPVQLIGIYVHINTHNKESLTQRYRRSTNLQLCLIFLHIHMVRILMDDMRYFASQITVTTSP